MKYKSYERRIMDFLDDLGKEIQENIEKENDINVENSKLESLLNLESDQGARPLSQVEACLLTVDRFEGDMAVLEDRKNNKMINVKREELPSDIKEGDILKMISGKYFIDRDFTQEISERIKKKMDDLWN